MRIPYSRLKITGKKEKETGTITLEQFNMLVESLSHPTIRKKVKYDSYIVMLYIGLYTGLRIAEVLALTRDNVDLIHKTIKIENQLHAEVENYTKTDASRCTIPIPNELVKILSDHFEKYPDTNLVCFGSDMNYLRYKSAIDKCIVLGEKSFKFHFHMLRYTFVTQAVRKKLIIKNNSNVS